MNHSWIGPSKIAVAQHCSGSLNLQRNLLPLPPTDYQLDGQCCHDYSANLLGKPTPIDHNRLNDEMIDSGIFYADYVRSIAGNNAVIEQRVNIPKIHPDCFGYPDAYYYDEINHILHVFDLKYGWRLVEAYFNWQLICYAAGIIPYAQKYVLHIIQPRPYHQDGPIRTHELDFVTFKTECMRIQKAVEDAINNPQLTTGQHCGKCNALLNCNARWQAIMNGVDVVSKFEAIEAEPDRISSQFLILEYVKDMITKQLDLAEQTGLYMINQGKILPGLTDQPGRGGTKWNGEPAAILAAADASGYDIRKKDVLKTPKQAISAGIPEYFVNALSKTYQGKRKLKPIDTNKASKIFGSK